MTVGIVVFCLMLFLVLLGTPIGLGLLGTGFIGAWLMVGWSTAVQLFTELPREILANYSYSVCPMFILMGQIANELGLVARAYEAARVWLRFSRAGLLPALFFAGGLFGAISGSSIASAGFLAKVSAPELKKHGYDQRWALGAIAAAGTLATLIPPSIMMVIFAMLTDTSVGRILIGGITPGIILILMMWAMLEIVARFKPQLFAKRNDPILSMREKFVSLKKIGPILIVFFVMLGGIYGGIFTPTAAGAVGVAAVLCIAVFKRVPMKNILRAVSDTAVISAQVFFVVLGGLLFSKILAVSGLVNVLVGYVNGLPGPLVFTGVTLIYLAAGAVLDPVSMLVVAVPVTYPVLKALGFDPVQIGIFCIIMVEAGVLTPPVGFNCYVVAGAANVNSSIVFQGMVPYFFVILALVVLIALFPQIVTFLPNAMLG